MPQNSVAYAVARVRVVGKDALDAGRLERLFGAPTYEEALRALAEIGFTGAEGATYEEIAEAHWLDPHQLAGLETTEGLADIVAAAFAIIEPRD